MANSVLTNISPCFHEEADTHLFLHAADAVKKGHRRLCVRTVDTDIVVIAIATFNQLAFGVGSNFHYIPVHEVVSGMDPRNVLSYQFFMHSQDVIPSHLLAGEGRRVLGKSGKFFLTLLKHLNTSF